MHTLMYMHNMYVGILQLITGVSMKRRQNTKRGTSGDKDRASQCRDTKFIENREMQYLY